MQRASNYICNDLDHHQENRLSLDSFWIILQKIIFVVVHLHETHRLSKRGYYGSA